MNPRDYPRMLFHRSKPAVTVNSEAEEKALGPGWSRTIPVPGEPASVPPAEQPDESEDDEPEEEEPPEEEEERKPVRPPIRKPAPKPVKPAARRRH